MNVPEVMVASSSSTDSGGEPPENFSVAMSYHENDGVRCTSAECLMRCPMCTKQRQTFHCRTCVREGNFMHSVGDRRQAERFSVRKAKYDQVQKRHRELTERAEELINKLKARETMRVKIQRTRENIVLMTNELKKRGVQYEQSLLDSRRLTKHLEDTRKKFPQYENNVAHLNQFVERRNRENAMLVQKRAELQMALKSRVRNLVESLVKYVFPVTQVMSRSEHNHIDSAEVSKQMNDLAEATRTAYIHGRWVLQDSQHEFHHVIVAPSLPGDGNYSAYVQWVASNKDGVPNVGGAGNSGCVSGASGCVDTLSSQNNAYRISAALTYTTQMVDLLSYFLDVHLPYRVNYGDFCNKELTPIMFARKVARLNGNILALCYAQSVPASRVSAIRTLANIEQLLAAEDLGRSGPVELQYNEIAGITQLNEDLVGGDDSDTDDDSSFPLEWEAVPHLAAHETVLVMPSAVLPSSSISNPQTVSIAGGLVNNAVASVTSMWGRFTGR